MNRNYPEVFANSESFFLRINLAVLPKVPVFAFLEVPPSALGEAKIGYIINIQGMVRLQKSKNGRIDIDV